MSNIEIDNLLQKMSEAAAEKFDLSTMEAVGVVFNSMAADKILKGELAGGEEEIINSFLNEVATGGK